MEEKIRIQINIAGRQYPMKVAFENESYVRKAAKLIEEKINTTEKKYAITDMQDILSLILIEIASELIFEKENNKKNSELLNKKIDSLLKL